MPARFYINLLLFSVFLLPASLRAEWDPFSEMESTSNTETVSPTDVEDKNWLQNPLQWQEDKDSYAISLDLAGADEKSMKVTSEGNAITIAQKQDTDLHEKISVGDDRFFREETNQEDLTKIVRVPDDANLPFMKYRFEDGILRITIPKKKLKSII